MTPTKSCLILLTGNTQAAMEALWNLEDKWKLSTQDAFLIFMCTAFAVVGLCTTTILKKKKINRVQGKQFIEKEPASIDVINTNWSESSSGWGSMKKVLVSTVRWSGANKWEEETNQSRNWRQNAAPPLLAGGRSSEALESGCWSHNSVSQVWQRPILMGEKCELPRFSGLILYDEQGRSLRSNRGAVQEEKSPAPVVTTLRDLL